MLVTPESLHTVPRQRHPLFCAVAAANGSSLLSGLKPMLPGQERPSWTEGPYLRSKIYSHSHSETSLRQLPSTGANPFPSSDFALLEAEVSEQGQSGSPFPHLYCSHNFATLEISPPFSPEAPPISTERLISPRGNAKEFTSSG